MVHGSKPAEAPLRGWARRRVARSREYLDAALVVIARDGLDGFTLQKLASETGSAIGAVYRYYPAKEALLVELQREILHSLHAELAATLQDAPEHPLRRITLAATWYCALPETKPLEFRLISTAIGDPRELVPAEDARRVLEASRPLLALLTGLLDDAQQRGMLTRGHNLDRALTLWAALHGVLQMHKLARADAAFGKRELAPALVRDLLSAWATKKKKKEPAHR